MIEINATPSTIASMVWISLRVMKAEVVIVAASAMDKAPLTPPSMATLHHTADILLPNLLNPKDWINCGSSGYSYCGEGSNND